MRARLGELVVALLELLAVEDDSKLCPAVGEAILGLPERRPQPHPFALALEQALVLERHRCLKREHRESRPLLRASAEVDLEHAVKATAPGEGEALRPPVHLSGLDRGSAPDPKPRAADAGQLQRAPDDELAELVRVAEAGDPDPRIEQALLGEVDAAHVIAEAARDEARRHEHRGPGRHPERPEVNRGRRRPDDDQRGREHGRAEPGEHPQLEGDEDHREHVEEGEAGLGLAGSLAEHEDGDEERRAGRQHDRSPLPWPPDEERARIGLVRLG